MGRAISIDLSHLTMKKPKNGNIEPSRMATMYCTIDLKTYWSINFAYESMQ